MLNACKTWYPRNQGPRGDLTRAVERRANGLTADYSATARKVDWMYCGTPRPPPDQRGAPQPPRQIGPVEARLNSFGRVRGWVFGAWGESSEEVHGMVQRLAEAKVTRAATLPGHHPLFQSRAAQLSSQVAYMRRKLSFTAVQSQARLLLDRLQLLGDGSNEAARRRDRVMETRRAEARERRAQHVCLLQGRAIRRSGFALLE